MQMLCCYSFGWDTHGLPVEFEIDKKLNIKGPDDVAKMGIAAYNDECRKIVMRYAGDWEEIIGRMGRWIGETVVTLEITSRQF
jgi:isoleucyl-tRNA synthetase